MWVWVSVRVRAFVRVGFVRLFVLAGLLVRLFGLCCVPRVGWWSVSALPVREIALCLCYCASACLHSVSE